MRGALLVLLLGALALMLQGALTTFLPPALCPDLRLLLVIGAALHLGAGSGLLVTAALGYGTDLLSGALLGQNAFLGLLVFAAARAVDGTLDLRRPLPTAIFAAVVSPLCGLGLTGLAWLFGAGPPLDLHAVLGMGLQAALNGACAPFVISAVGEAVAWTGEVEAPRRSGSLGRPTPLGGVRSPR